MSAQSIALAYNILNARTASRPNMRPEITGIGILSDLAQRHPLTTTSNQQGHMWLLDRTIRQRTLLNLNVFPFIGERFRTPDTFQDLYGLFQSSLAFFCTQKWYSHLGKFERDVSYP